MIVIFFKAAIIIPFCDCSWSIHLFGTDTTITDIKEICVPFQKGTHTELLCVIE